MGSFATFGRDMFGLEVHEEPSTRRDIEEKEGVRVVTERSISGAHWLRDMTQHESVAEIERASMPPLCSACVEDIYRS